MKAVQYLMLYGISAASAKKLNNRSCGGKIFLRCWQRRPRLQSRERTEKEAEETKNKNKNGRIPATQSSALQLIHR